MQGTKSDVTRQYMLSKLSRFYSYFIVVDIGLALTTAQAKNITIALATTLVRTS